MYTSNQVYVSLIDLWLPLSYAVLGASVVWGLLSLVFRDAAKGAVAASILAVAFLTFRPTVRALGFDDVYPVVIWSLGVGMLMLVAVRWFRATALLNFAATVLVLLNVGSIALSYMTPLKQVDPEDRSEVRALKQRPDVFYIILDGYGREDQLQRVFGYDNSEFLDQLRELGFRVPTKNHTNYVQTEQSLASSLNMEFLPTLLPNVPKMEPSRHYLGMLITRNRVSEWFSRRGYATMAVTTGFPAITFHETDVWVRDPRRISMFWSLVVGNSPLGGAAVLAVSQFENRRRQLEGAIDTLRGWAPPTSQPRFVVAHILAPHPPFVFGPKGEPRPPTTTFGYWDGSDFHERSSDPYAYRVGYSEQLTYLNTRILGLVRAMMNRSGPKPIVILQGDHGSKHHLNQNSLEKTDVQEAFANLLAVAGPDEVLKHIDDEMSPVNLFRVITAALEGREPERLPNRSWYAPFGEPYNLTEVTDRLK